MAACRVATIDGQETGWLRVNIPAVSLPESGHRMRLLWNATVQDRGYQPDCPVLITRPPGSNEVLGVLLNFVITRGTREWRLHRQCDKGPLTLIKSGITAFDPVNAANNQLSHEDKELPFGVSEVCWWAEVVDRHGNSSRLERLGCRSINRPPAPVLAPIIGTGTPEEPAMIVRFFAPPQGVDHFEILINDVPATLPALKNIRAGVTLMPMAAKSASTSPMVIAALFGGTVVESFKVSQTIITGPVGTGDGGIGTGPLFSVTVPKLNPRIKQKLVVRAVTKNGTFSERSNGQSFDWRLQEAPPAPAEDPCLPWPARNLPEVVDRTAVEPRIEALRCTAAMMPEDGGPTAAANFAKRYPLAIRVGIITQNSDMKPGHYPEGRLDGSPDAPEEIENYAGSFRDIIFKIPKATGSTQKESLFPFVVYRTQVANADFPAVSGDLVQVTPLMDRVAERTTQFSAILKDPYFLAARVPEEDSGSAGQFLLLDTQPAVRGAAYQYFIVRFRKDGEIDRVIRTNSVTVTP